MKSAIKLAAILLMAIPCAAQVQIGNGGSMQIGANVSVTGCGVSTPCTTAQGGTGATTPAAGLANLGGLPLSGGTLTGPLTGTSASFSGTTAATTTNAVESVVGWGADPTGVASANSAFLAATSKGHSVHIPAGIYLIDNTLGALIITSYTGEVFGDGMGRSIITCKVLTNPCLEFIAPSHLIVDKLTITFSTAGAICNPVTTNCGAFRNASHALFIHGGSDVHIDHVAVHDVPGAGILGDNGLSGVYLANSYVANTWANATMWANASSVVIEALNTNSTQDAAVEFSQYDGESGACQNITVHGLISTNDFSTILVNSCKNVSISNFVSSGTWLDAVDVRQDGTTTTTVWPDNVNISNGVIVNPGIGNTVNPAVKALNVMANSTDPAGATLGHITFDNIDVYGGNSGATAVFTAMGTTHFQYRVKVSGVRVHNAGFQCYDFTGGNIEAGQILCDNVTGLGVVIRTPNGFSASQIGVNNANNASSAQNALQITSAATGRVAIGTINLTSSITPSSAGFEDDAVSGAHTYGAINFVTADATNPTPALSGSTSFAMYSANGSAPTFTGALTTKGRVTAAGVTSNAQQIISADGTLAGNTPQVVITGGANANQQVRIGYDTTNNFGYMQCTFSGVGNKLCSLNPNGGDISINSLTDYGASLGVNGAIKAGASAANYVPLQSTGTQVANQVACVKAVGPPVQIGTCSGTVSATTGACGTCN